MLLGAADDGRGCPEEVAAISKRWSGGQVMRGRAAFISWLNSRDSDFLMRAQAEESPLPPLYFQIKGLCKQKSVRLFNSFCDLKIFN
jgi:hypothetical protein